MKLKLKNLEAQSFVTSMDKNEKQTVKGGAQTLLDCTHIADTLTKYLPKKITDMFCQTHEGC